MINEKDIYILIKKKKWKKLKKKTFFSKKILFE